MSDKDSKTTTKQYDLDRLRDIADIETVADYLGLEMQKRGSRISILCPCHNDRHFGSCYLTEKGFRCYSCNAKGSMFDLVRYVRKCSLSEAFGYVSDIYGERSSFQTEGEKKTRKMPTAKMLRMLGLEDYALSDSEDNESARYTRHKVYAVVGMVSEDFDPEGLTSVQRLRWVPIKNDTLLSPNPLDNTDPDTSPSGYYLIEQLVTSDPLRDLMETNERAYEDLICRKAVEATQRYRQLIEMAYEPARFYDDEKPELFLLAYYCNMIAERASFPLWKKTMEMLIRLCDDIRIEYGHEESASQNTCNQQQRRKSVFGKIRGGVSL